MEKFLPSELYELGKVDPRYRLTQMNLTRSLSRPKKILFSLILVFVSVSTSILIGEIVLRLLGYHGVPSATLNNIHRIDDPVLNWRHKPNSLRIGEGNITFHYNNQGFRDRNHQIDNPTGEYRIVVVGDSVTEGYGVDWENIFSSLLQGHFNDKNDTAEIITFAQGGLNTPQEIHLLSQAGLIYKPNLVILNFVLNDCDFYSKFRIVDCERGHPDCEIKLLNLFNLHIKINPEIKYFLRSLALFNFMNERVQNALGRIVGDENQDVDYFKSIWKKEPNRQKIVKGFTQLAHLQKQHNFEVLVIIWPIITNYSSYSYEHIHDWVKEQAKGFGFPTIDLLPHFSSYPYQQLQVMSLDHIHPNARGHKVAAEAFLSWFNSQYRFLGQ